MTINFRTISEKLGKEMIDPRATANLIPRLIIILHLEKVV